MKTLCSLLLIHFAVLIFGQENLTFGTDIFSGISSAPFSPTQPFLNENPWDINLIAEDVFVQNDYLYISRQSILGLTKAEIETAKPKAGITGENTSDVLDFYNKDFGNYHFSSDVLGPSFALTANIKEKRFVFGIFSRLRTQGSAIKVDNYLKYENAGNDVPDFYKLEPLKTNFMNWAETALHVSTEIFPYAENRWILGANLKCEMGFDAVHVNSAKQLILNRVQPDPNASVRTLVSDFDITASYATSYDFENEKYSPKSLGKGFGGDIGIAVLTNSSEDNIYDFKIALNLLDIGAVKFKGATHRFQGGVFDTSTIDNGKFHSPDQYMEKLSTLVYGDAKASLTGTDFTIGLPTSIHLNLSKNLGNSNFVNFNLLQRTPLFSNSLKRANIARVSYIIQKNAVGFGTSMFLYEYRNLQFGGYLRIGPLILGSENAFPLLFKHKKLHAADFYVALKLYPFWDNAFKRHRREKCYCD